MLKVYSKALDLLLSSVVSAQQGKPVEAAKYLAQAMGEEDFEQTMDALNDQQQDCLDQEQDLDFGVDDLESDGFGDQQQQSFSRALARVTANQKKVISAEGDDDSAQDQEEATADSESDKAEEKAGSGMFENEGDDAESVKIEHASAGSDDSEDDKPAFLKKDKDESKVMSSARDRLARATRAQANVAALKKTAKSAKKSK